MRTVFLAFLILLMGAGAAAHAYNGYASGNVNLRVGPGTSYHRLTTIPVGAAVHIHGCVGGYRWCDVTYAGYRGWSYGKYIRPARYRHSPRPYWHHAPVIGVPVIVYQRPRYFKRHYWHYRHKPWYHYGGIYHKPRYRHRHGGVYLEFRW